VEWVGGLALLPSYITGEGEPYRPEVLVWASTEGLVLGATVGKPGTLIGTACDNLRDTAEKPMVGRPRLPSRVRVASSELAAALRAGYPQIDVVCAATPELEPALEALIDGMHDDGEAPDSYLYPGIEPQAVAGLFRAAAGLYRARPWAVVPDDECIFAVTIEQLGLRDAALSVIGQMGNSLGLVLFASYDDFDRYLEAADAHERGEDPVLPPYSSLNFERKVDLAPALREEVAMHGWEIAGPAAYPWLTLVDEDLVLRPWTARDVTIAEALALALPVVLSDKKALRAAWRGEAPVARDVEVSTHAGSIVVALRAPYEVRHELLAGLFALAQSGREIDPEARRPLEQELLRRFAASPEARAIAEVQRLQFVMDFAADYFDATIATLRPLELQQIVFEIVPHKLSIDASAARGIVAETRALFAFLKRECALAQADGCLRVLAGDAVTRLEAGLSDTRNFGAAKALLMAGREAGFATDTPEGIDAWLGSLQSKPVPASVRLPPHEPSGSGQTARAQRKRNTPAQGAGGPKKRAR
jgi:hypothetical protein